jgi:hypothetical protein
MSRVDLLVTGAAQERMPVSAFKEIRHMNTHSGLLAAAVSGMLLGAAGCASKPAAASSPEAPSASATPSAGGEAHGCKGMNGCKGQGGCKTDQHGCKGQNECKGQGGCKAA